MSRSPFTLRLGADQSSRAAFGKSAFALSKSVLALGESILLDVAFNTSKALNAKIYKLCFSVIMADDNEDIAVLMWYYWEKLYKGENRKRLWVHPINEKREKENSAKFPPGTTL